MNFVLKSVCSWFFVCSLSSIAVGQVESDAHKSIGGGFEESITEDSKADKEPEEVKIDAFAHIPWHETYKTWNTTNIHAYHADLSKMKDTLNLVLLYDSCDYSLPRMGRITSHYGPRKPRYHYGTDVKLQKGDVVRSAFEGVVRISQYSKSYGNVIVVRHNNGLETLYAHLSKRKVKSGDHVEAGEQIGLGGNTGRSSGSHLHFECRFQGKPINPAKIINWETGRLKAESILISKGKVVKKRKPSASKPKRTPQPVVAANIVVDPATGLRMVKKSESSTHHTIGRGDTLYAVSRTYGVSVSQLCQLNGITTRQVLKVGEKIRFK